MEIVRVRLALLPQAHGDDAVAPLLLGLGGPALLLLLRRGCEDGCGRWGLFDQLGCDGDGEVGDGVASAEAVGFAATGDALVLLVLEGAGVWNLFHFL
jgi:hypothetical protein